LTVTLPVNPDVANSPRILNVVLQCSVFELTVGMGQTTDGRTYRRSVMHNATSHGMAA